MEFNGNHKTRTDANHRLYIYMCGHQGWTVVNLTFLFYLFFSLFRAIRLLARGVDGVDDTVDNRGIRELL